MWKEVLLISQGAKVCNLSHEYQVGEQSSLNDLLLEIINVQCEIYEHIQWWFLIEQIDF